MLVAPHITAVTRSLGQGFDKRVASRLASLFFAVLTQSALAMGGYVTNNFQEPSKNHQELTTDM